MSLLTEEHLEHWENLGLCRLEEMEVAGSTVSMLHNFPGAVCCQEIRPELVLAGEVSTLAGH